MKIGIDIDDTLVNTREKQIHLWKEYVTKYPKEGYTEELPETINSFDDEYVQVFWDLYRDQMSYYTTFKENSSEITNKLHEDGFTICIVTARPDNKYPNLKEELKKWFNNNNIYTDIIYTDIRDKATFCKENNIEILVDDSLHHVIPAANLGIKAILFNDKEYNGYKVNSWNELYELIKILTK